MITIDSREPTLTTVGELNAMVSNASEKIELEKGGEVRSTKSFEHKIGKISHSDHLGRPHF